MRYQVLKQYTAVQDGDPIWAQINVWVAILPTDSPPPDQENIFQTREQAELHIEQRTELQNEQDELGNDKVDTFGRTIKHRIYKIIEIE